MVVPTLLAAAGASSEAARVVGSVILRAAGVIRSHEATAGLVAHLSDTALCASWIAAFAIPEATAAGTPEALMAACQWHVERLYPGAAAALASVFSSDSPIISKPKPGGPTFRARAAEVAVPNATYHAALRAALAPRVGWALEAQRLAPCTSLVDTASEVFSAVEGRRPVLLIGPPGSGKTTLLRSLALAVSPLLPREHAKQVARKAAAAKRLADAVQMQATLGGGAAAINLAQAVDVFAASGLSSSTAAAVAATPTAIQEAGFDSAAEVYGRPLRLLPQHVHLHTIALGQVPANELFERSAEGLAPSSDVGADGVARSLLNRYLGAGVLAETLLSVLVVGGAGHAGDGGTVEPAAAAPDSSADVLSDLDDIDDVAALPPRPPRESGAPAAMMVIDCAFSGSGGASSAWAERAVESYAAGRTPNDAEDVSLHPRGRGGLAGVDEDDMDDDSDYDAGSGDDEDAVPYTAAQMSHRRLPPASLVFECTSLEGASPRLLASTTIVALRAPTGRWRQLVQAWMASSDIIRCLPAQAQRLVTSLVLTRGIVEAAARAAFGGNSASDDPAGLLARADVTNGVGNMCAVYEMSLRAMGFPTDEEVSVDITLASNLLVLGGDESRSVGSRRSRARSVASRSSAGPGGAPGGGAAGGAGGAGPVVAKSMMASEAQGSNAAGAPGMAASGGEEGFLIDMRSRLLVSFAYALVWGLGASCDLRAHERLDAAVRASMGGFVELPPRPHGIMRSFGLDIRSGALVRWEQVRAAHARRRRLLRAARWTRAHARCCV